MDKHLSEFNKKLKIALNMPTPKKPYISINKLAEYMQASSTRRREIVKNLKKDSDYTKLYYSFLKNTLPRYFSSGYDASIIDKVIANITKKKSGTSWTDTDHPNTILALECLKSCELPDLTDYDIVTDTVVLDSIMLADVMVTIKPDLYLRNKFSGKVGALKSHCAKTEKNRLDVTGMQYAATIIKYGFISKGLDEKEIDNNACISLDIFQENYAVAPSAYKRSMAALEAACEEIFLRWESV